MRDDLDGLTLELDWRRVVAIAVLTVTGLSCAVAVVAFCAA